MSTSQNGQNKCFWTIVGRWKRYARRCEWDGYPSAPMTSTPLPEPAVVASSHKIFPKKVVASSHEIFPKKDLEGALHKGGRRGGIDQVLFRHRAAAPPAFHGLHTVSIGASSSSWGSWLSVLSSPSPMTISPTLVEMQAICLFQAMAQLHWCAVWGVGWGGWYGS